jgi:pimeloyl-ACP methyl ester carboxylesterase
MMAAQIKLTQSNTYLHPQVSEIAAMDRRQKALLKRILSVFVPLAILLVLSVAGTDIYFAYRILHPPKEPVINTPQGYEQVLQRPIWDEKSWPGAGGTTMSGWLIYQDHPSPTVILTHGYGSNREEMLSTSYRLWDVGYNVVTYDVRGHGNSSVATSSLGPAELDDLKATIVYAKNLRNDAGTSLSDGRVGLFGVDLGGFVSLSAAAEDPDIRAVVVDTVYPTQRDYLKYQAKTIVGDMGPPNSSVFEMGLFQSLLSTTVGLMAKRGTQPLPAATAINELGERPVLVIISQASPLGQYTRLVTAAAPSAKVLELGRTHSGAVLLKQDQQTYDDAVVAFFTEVNDFTPPSRPQHPPAVDKR